MGLLLLAVCVLLSLLLLVGMTKVASGAARKSLLLLAAITLGLGLFASSVAYVPSDMVGIVRKNAFGGQLTDGKIIAVNGEMGVQADVLSPGWHFGYWPVIFSVNNEALISVGSEEVGLIEAADGMPLPGDQLFAPDFAPDEFQQMLDARHFLTTGKGFKGKQASVLKPGMYRLNTSLFKVTMAQQTEVHPGEVGVLKANYGKAPSLTMTPPTAHAEGTEPVVDDQTIKFASEGEMGIRAQVLPPGKYALNTSAFTVTEMWTTQMIAHYTAIASSNPATRKPEAATTVNEEREITVRTSDGFTFPVDVRVEYLVRASDAPLVVAKLGDDEGERFRNALNSAVRAIFRNNAESVRALDYVQMRSHQESQSLMLLGNPQE